MKAYKLLAALGLPLVLAACAGGGSVDAPKLLAPIPTLTPRDISKSWTDSYGTTYQITGESSDGYSVSSNNKTAVKNFATEGTSTYTSWTGKVETFKSTSSLYLYQTPDGKYYEFSAWGDLVVPGWGAQFTNILTTSAGVPTDNGGKMFGVTNSSWAGQQMRFGAWIGADGSTDVFAGGTLANVANMLGASDNGGKPKGKAIYEVVGVRAKNGGFVISTHDTTSGTGQHSVLVANFNTNKLGGKILGNSDYGADVLFKDVDINGAKFSGTATSDGASGQVSGGFFENGWSSSGDKIGGTVVFSGRSDLNTAFGGKTMQKADDDTSTDLSPTYTSTDWYTGTKTTTTVKQD